MGCFSHKIFLDMHSTISQASLHVKLGDTNWKICAILTENGKTYNIPDGSTAIFTGKKADNTDLFNDCIIENNMVVYDFTEQTCTSVGQVDCEIRLIDAEGKTITSPSFTIVVDNTVVDEDHIIESHDEVQALTSLIADVETKLENGEFVGSQGEKGDDGQDGYTPIKGVDYFTPAEQEAFLGEAKEYTDEKTAPATRDTYGTVKVWEDSDEAAISGGIYIDSDGRLWNASAPDFAIDFRSGTAPITPDNLEYAVKSVGDGYYALAEDLPKEKPYEKIADVVVTADADGTLPSHIIFSADSNGEPFELGSFYVKALIGATDGNAAKLSLFVNDNPVFGGTNLGYMLGTTPTGWALQWIDLGENNGALCVAQGVTSGSTFPYSLNINSNTLLGGAILPYMTQFIPVKKIEFWLHVGTTKTFVAGSTFELWGVRK